MQEIWYLHRTDGLNPETQELAEGNRGTDNTGAGESDRGAESSRSDIG